MIDLWLMPVYRGGLSQESCGKLIPIDGWVIWAEELLPSFDLILLGLFVLILTPVSSALVFLRQRILVLAYTGLIIDLTAPASHALGLQLSSGHARQPGDFNIEQICESPKWEESPCHKAW